jgi:magnesium transporter
MRRFFERYGDKVGRPPGTLDLATSTSERPVTISVIQFDPEGVDERVFDDVEQLAALPKRGVTWINVAGVHRPDVIGALGAEFGLHPLLLEDVVHTTQRPKVEEFDDHIYVVLHMISVASLADEDGYAIDGEQVSFVLTPRALLTFQEQAGDVFDTVRDRVRRARGRIRKSGVDYLLYTLLDVVVDHYFLVLERIGERVEELDELLEQPRGGAGLDEVHAVRRALLQLRRTVGPARDVAATLARGDSAFVKKSTLPFFRDVMDHATRVSDSVESLRELTTSLADLHMSRLSHRMNEVMKVLTVIATIFIPMTFIAGVYGMNFVQMPELGWRYGYPAVWAVMLGVGGGLVVYMRKRGWL